jgi:hypothetical protein
MFVTSSTTKTFSQIAKSWLALRARLCHETVAYQPMAIYLEKEAQPLGLKRLYELRCKEASIADVLN